MALAIPVTIIATLAILASVGKKIKKKEEFNKLSANDKKKIVTERSQEEREAEEIITVILPTINHDK